VRVALRHYLLDSQGTLYRLPSAALDRMPQEPTRGTASAALPGSADAARKLSWKWAVANRSA
jgi:FAD/FMN-containing dehydrogenase